MKGYEATHADASQTLRAIKNPAALQATKGLFALRKENCGLALDRDAPTIEDDSACLGKAIRGRKSSDQYEAE
jgi:hypothetical protein